MKRLFYGVAVSALMLGAGGVAVACDQHAHSAALTNPAAATQAATDTRGIVLAQAQQDEQSGTTGEDTQEQKPDESKPDESKPEALPNAGNGPRAGLTDRGIVLAQAQQEEQSGTSGEGMQQDQQGGDQQPKPDEEQK